MESSLGLSLLLCHDIDDALGRLSYRLCKFNKMLPWVMASDYSPTFFLSDTDSRLRIAVILR